MKTIYDASGDIVGYIGDGCASLGPIAIAVVFVLAMFLGVALLFVEPIIFIVLGLVHLIKGENEDAIKMFVAGGFCLFVLWAIWHYAQTGR